MLRLTAMIAGRDVPTSLLPGPTQPSAAVRAALAESAPVLIGGQAYGELQEIAQRLLALVAGAGGQPVILGGPSGLGHWAALRSTLLPGDPVLVIDTGPIGSQLAAVAVAAGGAVTTLQAEPGRDLDLDQVVVAVRRSAPRVVAVAHCEAVSATRWPIREIAHLAHQHSDALVCVDARVSVGGSALELADWGIDLGVMAPEFCLSVPADLAIVTVSPAAWLRIAATDYQGFESLARWRDPTGDLAWPYAPAPTALAALAVGCQELLTEGRDLVQTRHADLARYTRDRLRRQDLQAFPVDGQLAAPTVSACRVPEGVTWSDLDRNLQLRGVALAPGTDGRGAPLVTIGHMGTQADLALVKRGLDALADALPVRWEV